MISIVNSWADLDIIVNITFWPVHDIWVLFALFRNEGFRDEGSRSPALMRRLIRAFAVSHTQSMDVDKDSYQNLDL